MQARIAAFCRMFDLEAPARQVYRRSVHLTGALLGWCSRFGGRLEWILFGDSRCLVGTYREQNAQPFMGSTELMAPMARLGKGEKRLLLDCVNAHRAGEITVQFR